MYITIHNRKVHYKQRGTGDPLILLHGWGQNSYSLHQIAQKAARYFTVYSIDLPGFGKSDLPPKHWGLEGYAFMLKEFIKKKKLKHPHVMGHAFGGSITIVLASKEPRLLQKLIISSCPLHQFVDTNKMKYMTSQIPTQHPLISWFYPTIQKIYYRFFAQSSDLHKYPKLEVNFRRIVAQDLTPFLKTIKNNALILWGEDDQCTPVLYAYEMKQKIQDSFVQIIPEAAHDIVSTHPSIIWKEMKRFLLS